MNVSNLQLLLVIGIPTLSVLIGIVLNERGQSRLESRLTVMEGDLRRFYQMLGEHSGQIDMLRKHSGM